MNRPPLTITAAAVLLALFSVLNLATPLTPASAEGIPAFIIYSSVVLGVVGLAAVAGLWTRKRWGFWLTIAVSVLNILAAAPGLTLAPTTGAFVAAIVGVSGFALIILLVVLPVSRPAARPPTGTVAPR